MKTPENTEDLRKIVALWNFVDPAPSRAAEDEADPVWEDVQASLLSEEEKRAYVACDLSPSALASVERALDLMPPHLRGPLVQARRANLARSPQAAREELLVRMEENKSFPATRRASPSSQWAKVFRYLSNEIFGNLNPTERGDDPLPIQSDDELLSGSVEEMPDGSLRIRVYSLNPGDQGRMVRIWVEGDHWETSAALRPLSATSDRISATLHLPAEIRLRLEGYYLPMIVELADEDLDGDH